MKLPLTALCATILVGLIAPAALADDISDQIAEAQKAYEKHDVAATTAALDAAIKLLRQSKADASAKFLPDAPAGWTAADPEVTTVATEMFGGGTSVSRSYQNGDQTVTASLVADSPLMQGIGSIMANGQTVSDDSKLVIIDGRKFNYSKSDNSYTTMVGKVLVSIKGDGADDAALRAYLKAIRFADIEKASAS
jgi:hypothetical protein